MIILDVETTSLDKHTCVLSIGGVNFNPNKPVEYLRNASTFHVHVQLLGQVKSGRVFDEGTIKWLNGQEPAVVENAYKSAYSKVDLKEACTRLIGWLNECSGFDGNVHVRGVDFEGSIIPDMMRQHKLRCPITFAGYNDIRTLIRDYVDKTSSYIEVADMSPEAQELMKPLVKHIALDDCMIDAIQIIEGRRIRDERVIGKYLEMQQCPTSEG